MFNGYWVSVLQELMETNGGDDCTTLWMYIIPLNCTLKMANMVNFKLCVFYHNKKMKEKERLGTHTKHKLMRAP